MSTLMSPGPAVYRRQSGLLRKRALLSYVMLTFALSWGAMLAVMHRSLAGCMLILSPPMARVANLVDGFAAAAAMRAVVGIVVLVEGGQLAARPGAARQR